MGTFSDKVAIVTGGASGIGRALCEQLAAGGAAVTVADVDLAGAQEVARAIGARARAAEVDVTKAESVQRLVDSTASEANRLDYLFNNAGVAVIGEVRDLSLEHWRRVVDVNLWGVIHGVQAAYPLMCRQGHGHIVNTASGFGLSPGPTNTPYTTTKFAIVGLSESLRAEAVDLGVKVSVACPGLVRTRILQSPGIRVDPAEALKSWPFRAIEPDAAARAILAGVARGRAIIAFPFYVRFLTWLYRSFPRIAFRLLRDPVRDFRKLRQP